MTSTYVTVAIPFVNAHPHLGYAYELVLADIWARARRLGGADVRLNGGTDEYSIKNVLAADAAGRSIRDHVDVHAARFAALARQLDITFDDFLRTGTDPRHVPAVHRLWRQVEARGDLYRRHYEGDYCVGCERFVTAGERDAGGCAEHPGGTERVVEENWFFRLSRYGDRIEELLRSGRLEVSPAPFRREALAFVRAGLDDISVSRSVARARGWGVPVPGDDDQVVYVWFDALTNYVSALGFGEPGSDAYRRWWLDGAERTHVIGKGILRFHAVYWPAFLLSAGEPTPTHIRVHPYLSERGRKLSKSSGPTLDPAEVVRTVGADRLRWWFARDVAETADTDVALERIVDRADTDLAGGIGNVANRVVALLHRHRDGIPPADAEPVAGVAGLAAEVRAAIGAFELRAAARCIVDAVGVVNRDLEATEPWRLARDPTRAQEVDVILARQLAAVREIAEALRPITPALAATLAERLRGRPALAEASPVVERIGDRAG